MKETIKTRQYEYTGVALPKPKPLKQEVRLIAAGMETPIGRATMRLIELGIKEYKRQISCLYPSRRAPRLSVTWKIAAHPCLTFSLAPSTPFNLRNIRSTSFLSFYRS
jgi:hypothetical protein